MGRCSPRAPWVGVWLMLGLGLFVAPAPAQTAAKSSASVTPEYVDTMIREAWEAAGLRPSRPASDPEFLRRVYLDLLGRIPSIAEAKAFLDSRDAGKRTKLIETLLAHPDYPKNFANLWTVTLVGRRPQAQRVDRLELASWLRRQFAANRPWNEIAHDLITAQGSNKDHGAVNFPLAHLEFDAVPLTAITTRVFLGQQIQCTQCHDHPYNDWKQADFWGINAFFRGLRTRDVRGADASGAEPYQYTELFDEPTDAYASYERRTGLIGIAYPTYLDGRKIPQGAEVDRRDALAHYITSEENDAFAQAFVNRMWAHFFGRGFVHPVDDFGPHNPPSHPELLEQLADDFRASNYDIKALVRWILTSEAYQLSSVTNTSNAMDDMLYSHMRLKPMTPEQLFESLLVATAADRAGGQRETDQRRDRWMRQFIFAFANDENEESTSFQGTIPQALMMMNGDLMNRAVGGEAGSFLANLLEQARLQRRTPPDVYVVNHLYLAALSRPPTRAELSRAREFLTVYPDTIEVMEDLFWALLNSNEFILNH